ncbi:MAG TPA: MoaD/ThiS family protein [Ktedonobacterales bacterium]|jgi:molybdopterin converting factor small subunit|nr:MoaD/ThiS family protein [Ktedonobacterales bacterium]
MHISVRFFGPLRVVIGRDEITLTLSGDSATVTQALASIVAEYPQARRYLQDSAGGLPGPSGLPPGLRALRGDTRLDGATAPGAAVREGDRLTLLMPVIGG